MIVNLRADPFESAPHDSGMYIRWYADLFGFSFPSRRSCEVRCELKEYPPVSGGSLSGGLSYKSMQIQQALDMLNNMPGRQN